MSGFFGLPSVISGDLEIDGDLVLGNGRKLRTRNPVGNLYDLVYLSGDVQLGDNSLAGGMTLNLKNTKLFSVIDQNGNYWVSADQSGMYMGNEVRYALQSHAQTKKAGYLNPAPNTSLQLGAFNITNVVKNSTGYYTHNFTNVLPGANTEIIATIWDNNLTYAGYSIVAKANANYAEVRTFDAAGAPVDVPYCFEVFNGQ